MNAFVTGGGGFLGRHIVSRLLARGDTVRVLGRREYPDLVESGVECVQGDLSDAMLLNECCKGMDVVFHVAAKAGVWGPRESYHRPNVLGTENVLEGCRTAGVPRLIYTSTPSVVYGRDPIEGGDESLPYPDDYLTCYAETKAIAERNVLSANSEDLMTCALRPHLIWGPGDTNLLPRIADRARKGKLKQVGDGTNRVSVSYVENIADAHLAACDKLEKGSPVCGEAYFVNEEKPVNCWQFISELLKAMNCPPVTKTVPFKAAYAAGAAMEATYKLLGKTDEPLMTRFVALQLATSHWFKIDKAKRDLGWEPHISIENGLKQLKST